MGYDGKGQWILRTAEDVASAKSQLAVEGSAAKHDGAPFILERFVPFTRELSVLAVRGRTGETAVYPLVENHHRGGILRLALAPAPHLDPCDSASRRGGGARGIRVAAIRWRAGHRVL